MKKALSHAIGLNPFTIDDKLGDGTFAGSSDDLIRCSRGLFDIDFRKGHIVLLQETLGYPAVGHQYEE